MLAREFKFHFVNNLGVDMDLSSNSANEKIEVNFKKWKFTSGALVYNTEDALTFSASDVADGVSAEFTADDNSSDLHLGLHGEMNVLTDDASASGTVDLYVEFSTDGGTTYPSDAADFVPEEDLIPVVSLNIVGDGAGYKRSINFAL